MLLVETKDEARDAVLGLIPPGATIMAGVSLTLNAIGLTDRLSTRGRSSRRSSG